MRQSTGERDRRLATAKAAAIVESATRSWSRQEDLFASRDTYLWETAVEDYNRARMRLGLALATIEIDGQNEKALARAKDGSGRPFFAGRLLRDIDGRTVSDCITQWQALGLVSETIAKYLGTLRGILTRARGERGSDHRQLLGELPPIPAVEPSRAPGGWGRAITLDEYDRLLLALPTSMSEAPSLRRAIFELARRRGGVVTSAEVVAATGADEASVRTLLSALSNPDHPGAFLRRLHERQAGPPAPGPGDPVRGPGRPQGACLRRYRLAALELPPPPVAPVDHRGWVEICVWTAQHTSDVNTFTPDLFNLGPGGKTWGPRELRMPPGSFVWRNTKNKRRTKGRVRDHVREMVPELRACLERLARERGLHDGVPVAGVWGRGNQHRDLCAAARRSGLLPILDDRGRPHLLSANDLRRTAATWLADGLAIHGSGPDKSATEVIAEFLGHDGLDVARGIYDRSAGPRMGQVVSVFRELRGPRLGPQSAPPSELEGVSYTPPGLRRKR